MAVGTKECLNCSILLLGGMKRWLNGQEDSNFFYLKQQTLIGQTLNAFLYNDPSSLAVTDGSGSILYCCVPPWFPPYAFPYSDSETNENKNTNGPTCSVCFCGQSQRLSLFSFFLFFFFTFSFFPFLTPPPPPSSPTLFYISRPPPLLTQRHTQFTLPNGGRGNGVAGGGGWTDNRLREEWERCLKLTVVMWVFSPFSNVKSKAE